jgi:ribonuclease P protein component
MASAGVLRPLKSRSVIDRVFQLGKKRTAGELVVRYMIEESALQTGNINYLISVPKRKTPLATRRNRLKRLMRESLRLRVHLLEKVSGNLVLAFIYSGNANCSLAQMSELFALALQKIADFECREV